MPLRTELDAPLAEVLAMLKNAFPDGVAQSDYYPLLAVLYEHFSDRNLAEIIAQLSHGDPHLALNEIHEAVTCKKPTTAQVDSLIARLKHHGASAILTER